MDVQFVKLNPTQNMTILVESPVERERQPEVAAELMRYECVHAEQVGFVESPRDGGAWARLQMAGGEFCGNAVMGLAAYLVWKKKREGVLAAGAVDVPLEVSGSEGTLNCTVLPQGGTFVGCVDMPLPNRVEELPLPMEGVTFTFTTVFLPGIAHVVVPFKMLGKDPRAFAEQAVRAWEPYIGSEAIGVLLFDEGNCAIDPLVRVISGDVVGWERGCGSGTAAIGAYLARRAGGEITAQIRQPGGLIEVEAKYADGCVTALATRGEVRVAATGTAYVD